MKTVLTVMVLAFLSLSAQAKSVPASSQERKTLCAAVEAKMAQESIDFALDKASCLKSVAIVSEEISEGNTIILGQLKMNSPSQSFEEQCYVVYRGTPKIKNIVGGIDAGIVCQ